MGRHFFFFFSKKTTKALNVAHRRNSFNWAGTPWYLLKFCWIWVGSEGQSLSPLPPGPACWPQMERTAWHQGGAERLESLRPLLSSWAPRKLVFGLILNQEQWLQNECVGDRCRNSSQTPDSGQNTSDGWEVVEVTKDNAPRALIWWTVENTLEFHSMKSSKREVGSWELRGEQVGGDSVRACDRENPKAALERKRGVCLVVLQGHLRCSNVTHRSRVTGAKLEGRGGGWQRCLLKPRAGGIVTQHRQRLYVVDCKLFADATWHVVFHRLVGISLKCIYTVLHCWFYFLKAGS